MGKDIIALSYSNNSKILTTIVQSIPQIEEIPRKEYLMNHVLLELKDKIIS